MKLTTINPLQYLRKLGRLFWLMVVLPTAIAIIYYGFMATDVYVSESRFVVRTPERQATTALGMILGGAGFARADNESFAIQNYVLSRDAATKLDQTLGIKAAYSDPAIDIISRFPGLEWWDDSFENFHSYYQRKVHIHLDAASSVATLTVRSFAPELSHNINLSLLNQAETLVNNLNERARQDLIRYAASEVAALEEKAKAAALALAQFRTESRVIDPERQAAIQLQQIDRLREDLLSTRATIQLIEGVAAQNPQLPSLRNRAALLEREIRTVSLSVAGGERSLAHTAAQYQRLALDKEFADKLLGSAMNSLEQARNEAQRQQLYLERIVQPSLPDDAMEPRRLHSILAVWVLGLVAWGVLTMLIAGIREHVD